MSDLIERLHSSAEAFRKHPVYDSDGDPVLLIVQADECDEAAEALTAKDAEIARLREFMKHIVHDFENDFCIEGVIVDEPDPMLKLHYIITRQALGASHDA